MAEELWADESAPVPRPVFGAIACDRCGGRVELGELRGEDLYAAARRHGFVIGNEQFCADCSMPAKAQGELFDA